MIDYWNSTGLTGEQIVNRFQKTIDSQLALLYTEQADRGKNTRIPLKTVRRVQLGDMWKCEIVFRLIL